LCEEEKAVDSNFLYRNWSASGLGAFAGSSQSDAKTVFRALILAELRAGRLTRSGRARIVRYSSRIGLSPVEAGQLISQCAKEALQDVDPKVQRIALQLTTPPPLKVFWSGSMIAIASGLGVIILWAFMTSLL